MFEGRDLLGDLDSPVQFVAQNGGGGNGGGGGPAGGPITSPARRADDAGGVEGPVELYITFPKAGGTQSLPEGDTFLNYETGEAKVAGAVVLPLSQSLIGEPFEYMRSFFMEPDQDTVVRLDDAGGYTFDANLVTGIIFQRYTRVRLTTTVTTVVKTFASTDGAGGVVRG